MYLMGVEVTIRIFDSYSLKDKRRVVKSIIDKTHHSFKISAAELNDHDLHNQAIVGFGLVTNNLKQGEKILNQVLENIEASGQVEITRVVWE